jgi:shikimate kinase
MGQLTKTIALVGMMGAGKSSIGRRLAARMQVVFFDADSEIEAAAGQPIPEIFAKYGEAAFRDCERKVICRLMTEKPPHVLATGGGAFMSDEIRERLQADAVTVWLRAPLDILFARVRRKGNRPLLKTDDPRGTLEKLLQEREPIYALADITVDSENAPHEIAVERLMTTLTETGVWVP